MTKRIFITGASTGLGKATAILFAQHGWDVIATMQSPESAIDFKAFPNISVMALDVTNSAQIKSVAEEAIKLGNIDVVFNNAGYGLAGPFEGATDKQLTDEIDTNLLGVLRVTQAFIPHFREKKSGLFITTTSIGGFVTFPYNSVYHATKWALEGWSESMAFELKPFGIGIKTVAPGGIKTDFASRSLQMSEHPAYKEKVQKVLEIFVNPERISKGSTSEQIAKVVYEAATDGKEQLRYIAGADAKAVYAQRLQVGDEVFRAGIEKVFFG